MVLPPPPRPDVLPPSEERPPFPPITWRLIEAVPVFLMPFGFAALVAGFLSLVLDTDEAAFFSIVSLIQGAAVAGSVWFWFRHINPTTWSTLGVSRSRAKDAGVGFAVGIGMYVGATIVVAVIVAVATAFVGHDITGPDRIPSDVSGIWLLLLGPVLVVAAPIGEELFFRGFLYRALRERFATGGAIAVSAAVFAAAHIFPLVIPSIFFDGVILALLYERRRSLVASITAHATNNLIVFILLLTVANR